MACFSKAAETFRFRKAIRETKIMICERVFKTKENKTIVKFDDVLLLKRQGILWHPTLAVGLTKNKHRAWGSRVH